MNTNFSHSPVITVPPPSADLIKSPAIALATELALVTWLAGSFVYFGCIAIDEYERFDAHRHAGQSVQGP